MCNIEGHGSQQDCRHPLVSAAHSLSPCGTKLSRADAGGFVQELLLCQAAANKAQQWPGGFERLLHLEALGKAEPRLPLCSTPLSPQNPG